VTDKTSKLQQEVDRLWEACATLVMATTRGESEPEASLAPFWRGTPHAYVYVSELAAHTRNLLQFGHAGVMLLAPDSERSNAFARRRLSFRATAVGVARDEPVWQQALDGLETRFGATVNLIRPLQDFHLIRLTPVAGTYVRGFAQAYPVFGPELLVHDTGTESSP
jgi:putative heme iron utilization protein